MSSSKKPLLSICDFLATGFYSGRIRPCPGTFGTIAAFLCILAIHAVSPNSLTITFFILLSILTTIVGILCSKIVCDAKIYGDSKDPGQIVIDEFAGYFLTLVGAIITTPLNLSILLLAFVLFRLFDILKPPPIKFLERAPHGVGIMIDDLAAGIYAAISLQAILQFFPL